LPVSRRLLRLKQTIFLQAISLIICFFKPQAQRLLYGGLQKFMLQNLTSQTLHDAQAEGLAIFPWFDVWRDAVLGKLPTAPDSLPGQFPPGNALGGLGAVLKSHMLATLREAPHMTAAQRAIAMEAAIRMAPAVMQADPDSAENDTSEHEDFSRFSRGFYKAACSLVQRHCSDPTFNAAALARNLGRSRASLYRLFSSHEESVAATIWSARLESAWRMVTTIEHAHLLFSDISCRCGFVDQSSFNRMFKRRYGLSPREARAESRQG
jgi:AraC-like DNA-binding protein